MGVATDNYRMFMSAMEDIEKPGTFPLNIGSIILQSTSTNLESVIKPLTILDNILSGNVFQSYFENIGDAVSVLSRLFASVLSGTKYNGNQYIWRMLKAFIENKHTIDISIRTLDEYCKNKKLLNLIFHEFIKKEDGQDKYEEMIMNENQNLFKPDILKVFNKVD